MASKREGKGKPGMYTARQEDQSSESMGAWFLGPKGENADVFQSVVDSSMKAHMKFRQTYFPCDPEYITDELKDTERYQTSIRYLKDQVHQMQKEMEKSVPFFSSRYKGHVVWDTVMPANLGYITAMLYNQNNCTREISSVTTDYEVDVGDGLCQMVGYNRDSMGHLVTGGSIANIEAMWVARNLKFYPLGLKTALLTEKRLEAAKGYEVCLPQSKAKIQLVKATEWQLVNLDVDTIVNMPKDIQNLAQIENEDLMNIMSQYNYESIGTQKFAERYNVKAPCIVAPSTSHTSLFKAATILGVGKENLVTVAVDTNARMDANDLKRILEHKRKSHIPVIAVVSVMGSTEESAVDPLSEVVKLRKEMCADPEQPLNFSIHADGAWGGYFASMLREQPSDFYLKPPKDCRYDSAQFLSNYVHDQMSLFHECDTITMDPHKSGFCPYPAGALCYRLKGMNDFLNIASDVSYYYGNPNLGLYGLEGSKPGAAAAGVMLANRVIGLHKNGYGRILAECTFQAKIMYCMWTVLAQPEDNFVIALTKGLSPAIPQTDPISFIKERILNKSDEELFQDKEALEFLKEVGPDTLIPCFAVNTKGNHQVKTCNEINNALFKDLVHTNQGTVARRIPLIVTSSTMLHHRHGNNLEDFMERLGLNVEEKMTGVKYIITTCLDPWPTTADFMDDLGRVLRNAILCAIGTVYDPDAFHDFVSNGFVNEEDNVIATYVGNFEESQHQYFTMATLKFISSEDARKFGNYVAVNPKELIVFRNHDEDKVHDVLIFDADNEGEISEHHQRKEKFDIFLGSPSEGNKVLTAEMKVVDVPCFDHFDTTVQEYPESSTYFMYGDKYHAYIVHIPTKSPDFHQLVELEEVPFGVSQLLLKTGFHVELPEVSGKPHNTDPLTETRYKIKFTGEDGKDMESTMKLGRHIWFQLIGV